jgi:cytochrome b
MNTTEISRPIKVWDLPTRLFHWALVFCVLGLLVSVQIGGAAMAWHFRFGYSVLTLVMFRLIWGFVGGQWSRFSAFAFSPATALRYLKGSRCPEQEIGHNPLGAWSVFALLLFLVLQVSAGLFADDEISNAGPLVKYASSAWVNNATFYHKSVGKFILLGLIALHIGAIAFHYFIKKDNLVTPMVKGFKLTQVNAMSSRDDTRSRLLAAVLFALCGLLVAWLVGQAG